MFGIAANLKLQQVCDLIVVGAGPAGLSAALYTARKNLEVVVVVVSMDVGGQLGTTAAVENDPGIVAVAATPPRLSGCLTGRPSDRLSDRLGGHGAAWLLLVIEVG